MAGVKGKSGRQKGTLNKRTQTAIELMDASGKDPIEFMIELMGNEDKHLAFAAAKELAQYKYSKRRAIEISEDPNKPLGASSDKARLAEYREKVQTLLNERK